MSDRNAQSLPANMFVVAVMSRDRVGIVRELAAAIGRFEGNIERVSQTVVMNYFTLTLVVSFPQAHGIEEIRQLLRSAGREGEFEVSVKAFESGADKQPVVPDADCFILTATGKDRKGIIGQIAAYLAGKGVNILDLYAYKPGAEDFVLISELAVPRKMNVSQIQLDIEALGRQTGLTAALQHENIFKATNEVAAPGNFV